MNNQEKLKGVAPGAKKHLRNLAENEQLVKDYDKAISDAAEKHKVTTDIVELKDGVIYIKGLTEKQWEDLNRDDEPYFKGQR